MSRAKSNYSAAMVFSYAGGFLIGWPLGTALGGGDPVWALAGVGAGLIVVSIPFSRGYSKNAKKAVGIYNESLNQISSGNVDFKVGVNTNGIGLTMVF